MIPSEQFKHSYSHKTVYYERWDAVYCHTCNEWLSINCEDDRCVFCTDRPQKMVLKDES